MVAAQMSKIKKIIANGNGASERVLVSERAFNSALSKLLKAKPLRKKSICISGRKATMVIPPSQ